jgi:hypothetical protein
MGTCRECTRETAATWSHKRAQCLAGRLSDALHARPLAREEFWTGRTACSAGARPHSARGASATRAPQTSTRAGHTHGAGGLTVARRLVGGGCRHSFSRRGLRHELHSPQVLARFVPPRAFGRLLRRSRVALGSRARGDECSLARGSLQAILCESMLMAVRSKQRPCELQMLAACASGHRAHAHAGRTGPGRPARGGEWSSLAVPPCTPGMSVGPMSACARRAGTGHSSCRCGAGVAVATGSALPYTRRPVPA